MTDHQGPTRSSRSTADDAPQHEWLVVLDEGASATALNGLRAVAHVLHVAGPRLAVVTTADPESLRAVQGVRAVLASVPEHTVYSFSAEELLMVRAFMRRRAAQGPRPGDGLAWDAPGRQPPDCPPWV